MTRLLVVFVFVFVATAFRPDAASAQNPGMYGFMPFGFYQPYGARYQTSIRTPPYFSTNPPVYYGARHARPYGLSPFASPPQVSAGKSYNGRLRTQFSQPQVPTPQPLGNPCVSQSKTMKSSKSKTGVVRYNPYVKIDDQLVRNNPFVEIDKRVAKQ
jgi:hypothetical protein